MSLKTKTWKPQSTWSSYQCSFCKNLKIYWNTCSTNLLAWLIKSYTPFDLRKEQSHGEASCSRKYFPVSTSNSMSNASSKNSISNQTPLWRSSTSTQRRRSSSTSLSWRRTLWPFTIIFLGRTSLCGLQSWRLRQCQSSTALWSLVQSGLRQSNRTSTKEKWRISLSSLWALIGFSTPPKI